jgi:hypothetical protein
MRSLFTRERESTKLTANQHMRLVTLISALHIGHVEIRLIFAHTQ